MKNIEILDLDKKSDERGWLIEVLGGELPEGCKEFGQLHISVAYPGKFVEIIIILVRSNGFACQRARAYYF